jgi:ABC-type multidrug transport system ATPase subunit
MKEVRSLSKMDILFFLKTQELVSSSRQLKDFIHFLKLMGPGESLCFSYVDQDGPLLNNLTLRENIYLDSIPSGLSKTKEYQLQDFLRRTGNGHLIDLYSKVQLLDEYPDKVDAQTKKLAALTKGLLQKADYLLLDSPEKYLGEENTKLFIKALEFQVSNSGQIVLISSENTAFWEPLSTKKVLRTDNKKFAIVPMIGQAPRSIQAELPSKQGLLEFHVPRHDASKKAS